MRKSAHESVKSFISRKKEIFRQAYDRYKTRYKRRCVLIGTTNDDDFISNSSEWTRFWPVAVQEYNRDYLLLNRDAIWAEARTLYEQGSEWWNLPDELRDLVKGEREKFMETDVWEEKLGQLNPDRDWAMSELTAILEIPLEKVNRSIETRVGAVMRKLGYKKRDLGSKSIPRFMYSSKE